MSDRTKADISRENGSKSKGPKTAEGKLRSSRNGIRHGLSANQNTLLSMESAEEYDEVYQSYIDALRPATKAELRIVQRIANIDWRMERVVMMETCLQNMELAMKCEEILARFGSVDAIGLVVEAWKESCKDSSPIELLRRYQATLNHQMDSALKAFEKFEARREARKEAGLDKEPYQTPAFDTLRNPEPTEVGDDIEEGDLYLEPQPPHPVRPALTFPALQSEPSPAAEASTKTNIPKRPAA